MILDPPQGSEYPLYMYTSIVLLPAGLTIESLRLQSLDRDVEC